MSAGAMEKNKTISEGKQETSGHTGEEKLNPTSYCQEMIHPGYLFAKTAGAESWSLTIKRPGPRQGQEIFLQEEAEC